MNGMNGMNGMHGYAHRDQNNFDPAMPQSLRPARNPSRPGTRGGSYSSRDSFNSLGQENSQFGLINGERPQIAMADLKDPVQVHLLTETALLDSKEYEILPSEEVDALKKRCQALNQRIEQARANLAIQSKYRDAAVSMCKLYTTSNPNAMRGSLLGNRARADSDAAREAEAEREAIQKKCDDLAAELRSLEKRAIDPQRRLLRHTAGILQYAHKTAKKPNTTPKVPLVNGVPASPESMYTTSNGRNSFDTVDDFFVFDQGSLYTSFNQLDLYGTTTSRTNPLEIPAKAPAREQTRQLNEEKDKLHQENEQLRAQVESLTAELNGSRGGANPNDYKLITDTETKLERLNNQLREQIMSADPSRYGDYKTPPSGQLEPGDMIGSRLDYLENGLYTIGESLAKPGAVGGQTPEQTEKVLLELWDLIQNGYAKIRKQKLDERKARMQKGLEVDDDDVSESEGIDLDEQYSLIAFSSKVQWLYSQATGLQQQKGVLKRQIKQQRELNSRSDSEKDEAYRAKVEELERTQEMLIKAEGETELVRAELAHTLENLHNLQQHRSEESTIIDEAQVALRKRNERIAALEAGTKELQSRIAEAETEIQSITAQLQEANEAKSVAEKAAKEKQVEVDNKQKEIEEGQKELGETMGMVAELKMEAALAKAELDGAYGSRKERAAEAAALHDTSETSRHQNRIAALEKELKGTAKDLTDVVQQSLESEKKIGALEAELDKVTAERARLRDERERAGQELDRRLREAEEEARNTESRLSEDLARLRRERQQLQDELDNERLRSASMPPLTPGGGPRTSFLTEQYRSGLRAERRKHEEHLRAEQMARRRVEDELRALKKAQGLGGGGPSGHGRSVSAMPAPTTASGDMLSPLALSPVVPR